MLTFRNRSIDVIRTSLFLLLLSLDDTIATTTIITMSSASVATASRHLLSLCTVTASIYCGLWKLFNERPTTVSICPLINVWYSIDNPQIYKIEIVSLRYTNTDRHIQTQIRFFVFISFYMCKSSIRTWKSKLLLYICSQYFMIILKKSYSYSICSNPDTERESIQYLILKWTLSKDGYSITLQFSLFRITFLSYYIKQKS